MPANNRPERTTMQTQIQNTATNATANPINTATNINLIASRLTRLPHAIKLPPETPDAPELKRLLESRIAELEAEQLRLDRRDEDQALEFGANKSVISILRLHLDDLRRLVPPPKSQPTTAAPPLPSTIASAPATPAPATAAITPTPPINPIPPINPTTGSVGAAPTKNNSADLTEPNVDPQQHPTEPQVSRTEPSSPPSEPTEPKDSTASPKNSKTETADMDKKFAAELKKIPVEYHEIAADLYESLHHRSKFSKLTSEQRQAIYELCEDDDHTLEDILEIISRPHPIGIGFQTSPAGLKRFCADYKRILFDKQELEAHQRNEQERLVAEQLFQTANTSDENFRQITERQIRRRLFLATENPTSDYQEIRWLVKTLELLHKPDAQK
jgi:hypothetical protein